MPIKKNIPNKLPCGRACVTAFTVRLLDIMKIWLQSNEVFPSGLEPNKVEQSCSSAIVRLLPS